MFRGQLQCKRTRSRLNRYPMTRVAVTMGLISLLAGLGALAQSDNVEVVVWDTGPSIQGDDGAIVAISGPRSYEFYAGPDENQSNPHPLYLPNGDYSFTVTAVWPQQSDIDGTSDECGRRGRCNNNDIATFYIDFRAYETVPIAQDDSEITDEDTPVIISVLDNDAASTRIRLDGSEDSSVAFRTETLRRTTGPDLCCGDLGYAESQTFDLSVEVADTALAVVSVGTPSHGSASANPDGSITYTPDNDYCGDDQFEYTIEDQNGSDTATVFIEIRCVSDPPVAEDDSAVTDENSFVNIDVTANDSDPDGSIDSSTVTIVGNPRNGALDVDPATGVVTYTPHHGVCGEDSFSYVVQDFDGTPSNEASVTVEVVCNEPPVATDDHASTNENTSIGINVVSNDSDDDGSIDTSSVTITRSPTLGELSVHPSTGAVTYTPDPGACGVDSFRYTVDDDDGATSNEAGVTVDVMCDDPPLAIDDLYTVAEGETLDVPDPGILANDETNPEEPVTAILVSDVSNGTLSLNADGSFVYTHDGSETTSDTFRYRATDGTDDSNIATVSIVVTPTNDEPAAENDEDETDEDTPVTIDVLNNDSDPDGDSLSVDWVAAPSHGEVINNGSDVTYVPDPDFHGIDSFDYGVTDGHGGSATATVTVVVAAVNDPPVAQNDSAGTDEDTPIAIAVLDNDSDPDGDRLDVQSVTQPDHGTVSNNGSDVTYSPDPDFHGEDTFTYTASDGNGGTSTATVTVTVAEVNDPPFARDDQADTDEDTPISIDVLRNDGDPDGDPLSIEAVTQPDHGTVVNNGSDVTYTPDPDFHGVDTFTYAACDGNGCTTFATVTVTVFPVNDPPIAQDDSGTTDEDVPVAIDVLDNDSDPENDSLSVESVTQPPNGSVQSSGTDVTYTPDPNVHGVDTFTYTITDGDGAQSTAEVTVVVVAVNDPPVAEDDSDATDEDVPVTIDVLDNDSDSDGDSLSVQSIVQPTNGTVVNNGVDVTYTPDPGFHGSDSFAYTVSDGNGGSATATVTVTIASVNDPPLAQDDSDATDEDVPVTIDVLGNDSDPDGDTLSVQSVTQPANGTVANNGPDVIYTPDPDFHGSDSFTYTVSDGNGGTATATVSVAVATVNDAPIAVDDSDTTDEDTPITIDVLDNDSDPDGDGLSVQSVTQPANGPVANNGSDVVYTPDPGFHGSDAFTYIVSDGNGGTDTATVNVTVESVNDPPLAQDDSDATDEDVPVTIDVLANDSDPDGDVLSVQSVTQPANGTVVSNGVDVTYTPDSGFNGTDTFTYVVSDGNGGTDTATVSIAVATVNDPPIAVDDTDTTDEDAPVTIDVLDNDSDPDGDGLSVQSVTQPAHGSVINNGIDVTYVPDPGFDGTDTFTYTVSDGNGGSATATAVVEVAAVNDPPAAQDDSGASSENVPITIDVLGNDSDPDGDSLSVQSTTQPANGSVVTNGTDVTYAPDPGFHGTDTFTYVVSDGNGGTDSATVTVTIAVVNEPPVAADDEATTGEDSPVTIPVLANDSDPDGDDLAVESVTQPSHGAVVPGGTSVVYTPSPDFFGTDAFTYTISDGNGGTDTATVFVTVVASNDPPEAQDDSSSTSENEPVEILVLLNDSDPDGDPLAVEAVTQPASGSVINNGGSVIYTPGPGFSGTDTFTYTVSDGNGGTDTATVIVSVSARNNPPAAQDDSATTDEGILVTVPVLENDSDPDGDFLLVESFTQPANGSVLNARTGVSYIPNPGFQGIDTFFYTVSDGNGGTASATVTVSVAAVNDPPIATDDNAVTDEGDPVVIAVLLNDTDPDGDPIVVESVTQAENGTVSSDGAEVTYTPVPGFSGVDSFRYTVSDGKGGTDTATVFVAIAAVNDPPIAQNDSAETERDAPVGITVMDNDSDPDNDSLTVVAVTQPLNGTVVNTGLNVTYTPNDGFSGTDTFTYTIADTRGNTDFATVTVGVAGDAGAGGAADDDTCEGKVIIHEVAWAGTAADPRDEWIELRNLGTTPVDLAGWELRWRRTHPSAPEDQIWKVVELSGRLGPSSGEACDPDSVAIEPIVQLSRTRPGDPVWFLSTEIAPVEAGFYLLERRHDDVISDARADLLYDTAQTLRLDLSDRGEVIMLVNGIGEIVDTANASNLGRDGWAAGSATTFGTMERNDPLATDTADNWHTNVGIVTHGEDAKGHLLRATPGATSSPVFESLAAYAKIDPVTIRAGEELSVDFPLPRQDRRTTGWPWISVTRPGFSSAAGAGGAANLAGYSFSGRYDGGERYVLDIGTGGLPPGTYVFWITYGQGRAALVPIIVAR